jgi:hypothetical protein
VFIMPPVCQTDLKGFPRWGRSLGVVTVLFCLLIDPSSVLWYGPAINLLYGCYDCMVRQLSHVKGRCTMIDVSLGFEGFRYAYVHVDTQQNQRHAVESPSAPTLQV